MSERPLLSYSDQLKSWQIETQADRAVLLKLTGYFDFQDDPPKEISTDTWTKTVTNKPPFRREGKQNLYKILGAFYVFKVITEKQMVEFLNRHHIESFDGRNWDFIWNCIRDGAEQGRRELQELSQSHLEQHNRLKITNNTSPEISNRATQLSKKSQINIKRFITIRFVVPALGIVGVISLILIRFAIGASASNPQDKLFSSICVPASSVGTSIFLRNQGFSLYQLDPANPKVSILSNSVRTIGNNKDGVWVGYSSNGNIDGISYYEKKTDRWIQCPGLKFQAGQTVNDFLFKNDNLYVAIDATNDFPTDPGIARLNTDGWKFFTNEDGLPKNIVYDLSISGGDIFASTYEGVIQLFEDRWRVIHYAQQDKLACGEVRQFLEDPQKNRWFALLKCGLSYMDADLQWTSYFTSDDEHKNARAIVIDNLGGLWVATDGGGVLRLYNQSWTFFKFPQIPSMSVRDVKRDKFGRIWIATDHGVAYTSDYGKSWETHSTMDTLQIEFGCAECAYDENHLWLALKNTGLGHVRIPPSLPTIEVLSVTPLTKLKPGDIFTFEVEVLVKNEGLFKRDGDSLRSNETMDQDLYGAYETIEMTQEEVQVNQKYVFSNRKNPIIAPSKPGKYELSWRVWQGRRFVTAPIIIEFEVVGP